MAPSSSAALHPPWWCVSGSPGPGLGADVQVSNHLFKFRGPRKGSGCCSSVGAEAPCDGAGRMQSDHRPRNEQHRLACTAPGPECCCGSSTKGHTALLRALLSGARVARQRPGRKHRVSTVPRAGGRPASGRLRARADGAVRARPKVSTVQLLCITGVQSRGWKIPTNPAQAAQQERSGNVQTSADPWLEVCSPQDGGARQPGSPQAPYSSHGSKSKATALPWDPRSPQRGAQQFAKQQLITNAHSIRARVGGAVSLQN